MASETVLIVDDEKEIADLLALYLKNEVCFDHLSQMRLSL